MYLFAGCEQSIKLQSSMRMLTGRGCNGSRPCSVSFPRGVCHQRTCSASQRRRKPNSSRDFRSESQLGHRLNSCLHRQRHHPKRVRCMIPVFRKVNSTGIASSVSHRRHQSRSMTLPKEALHQEPDRHDTRPFATATPSFQGFSKYYASC